MKDGLWITIRSGPPDSMPRPSFTTCQPCQRSLRYIQRTEEIRGSAKAPQRHFDTFHLTCPFRVKFTLLWPYISTVQVQYMNIHYINHLCFPRFIFRQLKKLVLSWLLFLQKWTSHCLLRLYLMTQKIKNCWNIYSEVSLKYLLRDIKYVPSLWKLRQNAVYLQRECSNPKQMLWLSVLLCYIIPRSVDSKGRGMRPSWNAGPQ